ncbi:hypothetical protein Val02_53930 [Virgisporangium aliadipatigenens]|uniref:Uncharacterized protein n=1 Tax=Virgisporangium aliadipatigenens TaxID=741659 RepID=A0A8J4DTT0_9ACTN|nr:hypothetical protein [Virgisporangium aliadipatigenens]GIJ48507.1 hypothetical protein Val02_53930 [Virgisporangium aliadipatigenens]
MTPLEDELSRVLRDLAGGAPTGSHLLADAAIARGRARLRRQQSMVGAVALCFLAGAVLMVLSLRPLSGQENSGNDPSLLAQFVNERMPVDVISGGTLYTVDGRAVPIALAGTVERAYRARAGYLLVERLTEAPVYRLSYLDPANGSQITVVPRANRLAVGPEARVAGVLDGKLFDFRMESSGSRQESTVPAGVAPVGFVGEAVVLSDGSLSGGGLSAGGGDGYHRYDVWFPKRGAYKPTWSTSSVLFGAWPDGKYLVAAQRDQGGSPCLVSIRVEGLGVEESACDVFDSAVDRGWLSPDGRWLLATGQVGARVYDLESSRERPASHESPVSGVAMKAFWLDRSTVVLREGNRVGTWRVDRPKETVRFHSLPGDAVVVNQ